MQKERSKKWVWMTIAIIALVFIIFAAAVDFDVLLATLKSVHVGKFTVGVIFLLLGIVLITIRWRYLLRNQPEFAPTFHANSISYMLKLLLPIPQAVTRLTTLSLASSISIYQSSPVMVIERFLEMVMRLVALTLGIVLILDIPLWVAALAISALLLVAIPAFVMWFARNASKIVPKFFARSGGQSDVSEEKVEKALAKFQDGVSTFKATRELTVAVAISLAMWGLFLLFYISGFLSLSLDLDRSQIYAMSAVVLAFLPPSTPAMIGVYQGIIVAVLLPFGLIDVNTATAYALLMFGAQLVVWIVLGVWGLKRTDIDIRELSQRTFDENEQ